ncbi:hypothetical protein M441DRAFT_71097 [Trichoderma asperellum CBS 433.97]|uniref:Uncharacterized protein n=1 Tax=Trichoderma asperellum (strain ATCC 204424 / CBS 433.97 / NBRC 101777) TaxID=1042311 RepID=A0A2T3Z1R3_TRIA4|nr:hypothetical protein M441DRAFT_71097 [Trichoderma asperellum CBS 433.97]PTB38743.1 hypothetical protein M441DRAFT_71097 [Trichoderma asperellum CBS 433.97]
MGNYSLYGFRFESESLLLVSDQEELGNTEAEYEQWQNLLELDAQASISLQSPNNRYEANQIPAAEHISVQNYHTQGSDNQQTRRINVAHRHSHLPQLIDWGSDSGSGIEDIVGIYGNDPQGLLDSPDEPIWQILYSFSYQNRLDPGRDAYEHTVSAENEAGAPHATIKNESEDENYPFEIMVESGEEHSHDEDSIFDVVSEEESTDDECGFESDDEDADEDSDSDMDLSEDDGHLELAEEAGETTYMLGGDLLVRIPTHSVFDRYSPEEYLGETILDIEWPNSGWQNAFNQTEQN